MKLIIRIIIKLKEEETIVNNINNIKERNINNNIEKPVNKTNINNPQFIVNKIVNNNNLNDNSLPKIKNRTRFLSFNDDASQLSKWSSINSKKIEISNNKLIIDNYNINQPEDIGNEYEGLQYNNFNNSLFPKYEQRNNNIIIKRKNSAFSAIIK